MFELMKTTGELKDTFKFTYRGRRYERLSLSEKIRAGMEVSELLKRLTGRNYPVFVDNMESVDDLENVKTASNVEYGVINFNGYASLEEAETYIVEMTYFEAPYKTGTASISDDFAQLAFDIDKSGKVTSIRWYYYPEE